MSITKGRALALAVCAGTMAGITGVASGQLALSMSYENLTSEFDASTDTLTTRTGDLSTASVTRFLPDFAQARFTSADFGQMADFMMDLSVDPNGPNNTVLGTGMFTATDMGGNEFSGEVEGTFSFVPGSGAMGTLFFNASVPTAGFSLNQNNMFTGSEGSFAVDVPELESLSGALQRLELQAPNFLTESFTGGLAEVDGQFVPAPGSAALLMLGGLAAFRRRR